MVNIEGVEILLTNSQVHDITQFPDITEFLFAADAMISDYTSAMFDYSLLRRPCFIYTIDKDDYDRGFYWEFEHLPFIIAETEEELIENVKSFSFNSYIDSLRTFQNEKWGLDEDGHSCERLYNWMIN